MRNLKRCLLTIALGAPLTACVPKTDRGEPTLADTEVPIETNVGNEEGDVLTLGRCYPEYDLADESAEIQALDEDIRNTYIVSECPTTGCGVLGTPKAESNMLKNRASLPDASEIDSAVTLADLLAPSDDDRELWSQESAASIIGYVREVKGTGAESVNCKEGGKQFSDTHIDLVLDPDDPNSPMFVVEVTQRMRALKAAQGEDWSSVALRSRLKGKWVEFTGWMFFDQDHCNESENTDSATNSPDNPCGGPNNPVWRRTAWEIHPVTDIRMASAPQ
jgi:hypothetical protein